MRFTKAKALLIVLAIIAGLVTIARPALAQGGCLPDVGKKTAVIFVHGLGGDNDIWGAEDDANSMIGKIKGLTGSVEPFSYKDVNRQWVTSPKIGLTLAQRISCIAQSSREQGGTGKVIVVAHSMGGLATRYAASLKVNGRAVSDDIGMVVTIATPNTGSNVASAAFDTALAICNASGLARIPGVTCDATVSNTLQSVNALPALRTGSQELADLPWLPRTIPVLAIGGNITQKVALPFINFEVMSNNDSYVDIHSALRGKEVSGLGGNKEVSCTDALPVLPLISNASCAHGNLVNNPQVQKWVTDAIHAYQQKIEQKPVATVPSGNTASQDSFTFQGMTLKLAKNWKPEVNSADGRMFIVGQGYCYPGKECPRLEIAKIPPGDKADPPWGQYINCGHEGNPSDQYPIQFKELFQMGAKRAAYYEQKNCNAPFGNLIRYWVLPKSGILLSTTALRGPVLDDIYLMLRSALFT